MVTPVAARRNLTLMRYRYLGDVGHRWLPTGGVFLLEEDKGLGTNNHLYPAL